MADAETIDRLQSLLRLSHELGREDRALAILAEGNTSTRFSADTFLVKASGSSLSMLAASDVVECRTSPLLALFDRQDLSDSEIEAILLASRVNPDSKKPSVEALFHSWLLSLDGVEFVGHTHPVTINSVLCSPRARDFASRRLFPDEIVCCGSESVFVPYTDPGLKLARAVRAEAESFIQRHGRPPRVILMGNHGMIALGRSIEAVMAATLMAAKAAGVFLGAAALGGPVFLRDDAVGRISGRPDEALRRRLLNI